MPISVCPTTSISHACYSKTQNTKIILRSISICRNRSMAEYSHKTTYEIYLWSRLTKWHKLNVIKQQTPVTDRSKWNLEQSAVQVLIFHRF